MLESQIEAAVAKYARDRGVTVLKLNGPGNRGKPDRMFMFRGRVLVIEFKAPGKKPTKLQQSWLDTFNAQGFVAVCMDSVGDGKTAVDALLEDELDTL